MWILMYSVWRPCKKRKFGHTEKQGCACTEKNHEDTARRWPPASQKVRPQKKPNLLIPWSWASMLTTISSLLIHGHGMFLRLFRSFLIYFISVCSIQHTSPASVLLDLHLNISMFLSNCKWHCIFYFSVHMFIVSLWKYN